MAGIIDISQVTVQKIPTEGCLGRLAAVVSIDFTAQSDYDLNLQLDQWLKKFDVVQTVYVDNRTGSNIDITFGGTGQVIRAKANTQGYYNVLAQVPTSIHFNSVGGSQATVLLINDAIPGAVWPTV